jgi:hypothetical protein|tara:strand:+ start:12108 stop:13238 length:1131 start_codon:yes stop_codon:yes gene_type:complete
MAVRTRGRYSPRLIRDPRGMQAAKNLTSIADKASEMYNQATQAKEAKKLGMKVLTKKGLEESQAYKDVAKDIAKVHPDLDAQIIAEIENNARLISDQYMKAYGPDGTPEDMIAFQKLDNDLTSQLNDLTIMIGTLDGELEAYDLAKAENRLIGDYNTLEDDLFQYNITNGKSDVKLSKNKDGKYQLTGRGPGAGNDANPIIISDYVRNLKNNGSTFKEIDKNIEGQTIEYGKSIADALKDQVEIDYKGQGSVTSPNPSFDPKKPVDPIKNPREIVTTESFTFIDPGNATQLITKYLNDNMSNGFRNLTGSKSMPNEEHLWEQMKKEGIISSTDAWNPTKQAELNAAYAEFIVNDLFPTGKQNITRSGKGGKAPRKT